MLILRQKMVAKPDKSDELMAALAEIITPARATAGVISLDIARVLLEPDSFIATAVYEDGAALERQESRPEVREVVGDATGIAGSPARANDLRCVPRPGARLIQPPPDVVATEPRSEEKHHEQQLQLGQAPEVGGLARIPGPSRCGRGSRARPTRPVRHPGLPGQDAAERDPARRWRRRCRAIIVSPSYTDESPPPTGR